MELGNQSKSVRLRSDGDVLWRAVEQGMVPQANQCGKGSSQGLFLQITLNVNSTLESL